MDIKLNEFPIKNIKVEDATFTVREMDYEEVVFASMRHGRDKNLSLNLADLTNNIFERGVIGWDNLTVNGILLPYSDAVKDKIPFLLKSQVANSLRAASTLNAEEKKT